MKRPLVFLLALSLCLTLTACFDADTAEETPGFWELEPEMPPSVEEPARVTEFTLPYLNSQTLDPIACSDGVQQTIGSLLYESLFTLDENFVPHAFLCSSYECGSKGLSYTFRLHDGVTFSDGSVLTANDVLATYRRAQASDRYAARFANVVSMRVNRGALIIALKSADSALPALLDIPIVKSGTEKDAAPLGTGPYWFRSDEDGAQLARRENWWRGSAALPDHIALTPAKDSDTAAYLFSAEAVHLLTADLLGSTSAAAIGGVDMVDAPTTMMLFLGFNTKRAALSKASNRAALGLAIDRTAVAETLFAGHALPAQFPLSPVSPLYPAALEAPADGAAAAEAFPAGDGGAKELTLLVNEENRSKVSLAEHLARQLSTDGLTVTPAILPWADYLAALRSGEFDLWLGEVRLTADWDVSPLIAAGGALNYGRFSSAELEKALAAFLADETAATAAAFGERFAADAPFLPLAFKTLTVLTPKDTVEGVSPTVSQPLRGWGDWIIRIPQE